MNRMNHGGAVVRLRRVLVAGVVVMTALAALAVEAPARQESAPSTAAATASRPVRGVRQASVPGLRVTVDERRAVWMVDTPNVRVAPALDAQSADAVSALWPRATAPGVLPGTAQILAAARAFDEDLMATLERFADAGLPGVLIGRRELITRLSAALRARQDDAALPAIAMLEAAQHVMGLADGCAWTAPAQSAGVLAAFDKDRARSTIVGLHRDVPELAQAFRRVRLLSPCASADSAAPAWLAGVRTVLASDTALREAYARLMTLDRTLGSAFGTPSLTDAASANAALFPSQRTLETDLLAEELRRGDKFRAAEVAERVVSAIRGGKLTLAARSDAGWNDHRNAALDPLLREAAASEGARVQRTPAYQKSCDRVFREPLTQVREGRTSGGNATTAVARKTGDSVVTILPVMRVEPQVTVYRRVADSYAWLSGALTSVLGVDTLHGQRLSGIDGKARGCLDDELQLMERRMRCLAILACDDLGCDRALAGGDLAALQQDEMALAAPAALADMLAGAGTGAGLDSRVMVPVAYDAQTRLWSCRALVGVTSTPIDVYYAKRPEVVIERSDASDQQPGDDAKQPDVVYDFGTLRRDLHQAVWIACEMHEPLSRRELRQLCDEGRTLAGIQARLVLRR